MTTVPASDKHYTARIIERKDLSEDLWLIGVDPGGPFQFKAGQYATLGVDHVDKRIGRAYSIVSSPYEQGLEFFIELVPHGELTPHLYKLQTGDTMLCRKVAKGRFTLDIKSGRTEHLLLATVTGIAPFVSYVRTMYKDWKGSGNPMPGSHKRYCLQGGSRSWEFGYREELDRIAAEVPWFKFVTTISRPWEDAAWKGGDRPRRRFGPKVHRSVGAAAGNHDRVPLWPSQHVRERARHPQARRLAKGLHVRRGPFHPGEGSDRRVAHLGLVLILSTPLIRRAGVQCRRVKVQIRTKFSSGVSEGVT
jgi:ferredoxin/flavodoxin---NADP+ reductase